MEMGKNSKTLMMQIQLINLIGVYIINNNPTKIQNFNKTIESKVFYNGFS